MKRLVGLVAVLALVAAGCGDDDDGGGDASDSENSAPKATETAAAKGPLTYTVIVDGPSPEGKNVQLSAYFPGEITVHAGDTIVFDNQSTQVPHTITFGVNPDRSNSPGVITKTADFNPAVFGPCVTTTPPVFELEGCPEPPPAQLPPYSGKGYWNSGALAPAVAPEGPKQVQVKVDESVPAGQYAYVCVLHSLMNGTVRVIPAEADREPPEEVADRATEQAAEAAAAAAALPDPPAGGSTEVAAGWGDEVAAINRFSPGTLQIKAGETVTWKTLSPYEPHTVTFEPPFTSPEDPRVVPPGGVKSGGNYTRGFSNSGFIGPKPFPSETFSLRFTRAGTYGYVCAIHPGMAGTVEVV